MFFTDRTTVRSTFRARFRIGHPAWAGRNMTFSVFPRLVISGLSGGGGKTFLSLGLARRLRLQGMSVKPYKKGPDYIDAAWLGLAARQGATNLDPFFLDDEGLVSLFQHAFPKGSGHGHVALVEGNRGLYDGRDISGSCSTARLARVLNAPIVLVLNCTKMTRTAAAVVAGVAAFEPVHIAGIVLNQVGSSRHEALVRKSIEMHTGIPVLGAIPRLRENPVPERHMGLQSIHAAGEDGGQGSGNIEAILDCLADLVHTNCDVNALLAIARAASPLPPAAPFWERSGDDDRIPQESIDSDRITSRRGGHGNRTTGKSPVRIGYVRDAALWFYYEENLEALRRAGAELAELSLLSDTPWPEMDGLYLGGGFPEMLAASISTSPHLADIRNLSLDDRPVYAECGGLMVLCRELAVSGSIFRMADIFPVRTEFASRPQGLGYVEAKVDRHNPFLPCGLCFRGHEFHYSRCVSLEAPKNQGGMPSVLSLCPGRGLDGKGRDGLLVRRTFAAYTHLFAPAVPQWAPSFVNACLAARSCICENV